MSQSPSSRSRRCPTTTPTSPGRDGASKSRRRPWRAPPRLRLNITLQHKQHCLGFLSSTQKREITRQRLGQASPRNCLTQHSTAQHSAPLSQRVSTGTETAFPRLPFAQVFDDPIHPGRPGICNAAGDKVRDRQVPVMSCDSHGDRLSLSCIQSSWKCCSACSSARQRPAQTLDEHVFIPRPPLQAASSLYQGHQAQRRRRRAGQH